MIVAGEGFAFSQEFRDACRRKGFEPEAIVSLAVQTKTVRRAGRILDGIDVAPWAAEDIIVGATFVVTLANGAVAAVDWDSPEPWASKRGPR